MTEATPPGWYDDPSQPGTAHYWDGNAWTDHVRGITSGATTEPSTAQHDPAAHLIESVSKVDATKVEWRCSCGVAGVGSIEDARQHRLRGRLPEQTSPSRTTTPAASQNDTSGASGCLGAALIIAFIAFAVLHVCSSSPAGNGHYTQDAWLRCKDILYGSDYPEDRLTSSERDTVTQCAIGASK